MNFKEQWQTIRQKLPKDVLYLIYFTVMGLVIAGLGQFLYRIVGLSAGLSSVLGLLVGVFLIPAIYFGFALKK